VAADLYNHSENSMKLKNTLCLLTLAGAILPLAGWSQQFRITEVDAAGSSNTNYAADWFELTYTGVAPVSLTGWRMDDSSASAATSVALRGVTTIQPGQSVIFLEGNATGTTDLTISNNFISTWFGSSVPAGLTLGFYGGSSVGLSTTAGDGVVVFDSSSNVVASVLFGVAPAGATFDNSVGLNGSISQASVVGVNGAFTSFITAPPEVGSPGVVPEPSTVALGVLGLGVLLRRRF
jgi:hypothetical protein